MLRNELAVFDRLIFDQTKLTETALADVDIAALCRQVQNAWLDAILSGMPRDCLTPYFCYQLKSISEMADTLQLFSGEWFYEVQNSLLSLIDHLRNYYYDYLNTDCNAPMSYHLRVAERLQEFVRKIKTRLNQFQINPRLIKCIDDVLEGPDARQVRIRYTYRALDYTEDIIAKMASISWEEPDAEGMLVTFLIQLNYNHLAFFKYYQHRVLEKGDFAQTGVLPLDFLRTQRANLVAVPQQPVSYAPFWPSIKSMIADWLDEQIKLAESKPVINENVNENMEARLTLDCSVASLACLIKLLDELDIFGSRSLSSVFIFCSNHFNTRRQPVISPGSLSKEYYTINQHTAKRILELLQKMISWLNRNFFPAWVVVSIIIGAGQGNQ